MIIGIIGKGKMGRDIFNHFLQYEYKLILICKKAEDIEDLKASIEKQLKKSLRRGYLSQTEYENKKTSYSISNDISCLECCDMVIESVYEDKALKQDVFRKLETVVKDECILASNTSSIPLNIIFGECKIKNRCMGIHFFYPVKITKTVEINKTKHTNQNHVRLIKDLLIKVDKTPLELEEEANMVLTKIFTTIVTQIYKIYEEKYLTKEQIDAIAKENFLTFGLFEIIDSTGINIILESIENFISARYVKLYIPLYNKACLIMREGYDGLLDYENKNPVQLKPIEGESLSLYKENLILRLQSLLINELAYVVKNYNVDKQQINNAIKEFFGLSQSPLELLENIDKESLQKCLNKHYKDTRDQLYKYVDFSALI